MEHSADSAFYCSTLALPRTASGLEISGGSECLSFLILAGISVVTFLVLIKIIVEIVPSLMANLIRWKESLNLEASVKLSRNRNIAAAGMVLPFCLVVYAYKLYSPKFLTTVSQDAGVWIVIGLFFLFFGIRTLLERLCRPKRVAAKTYNGIVRVAYSFFIILTILLLLTSGISAVFDLDPECVRVAMLWLSAAIYFIYLIRKMQIFASSCSLFAGFLYLCALEILPTGVLIASAVIF